jgi:hypothetical protein
MSEITEKNKNTVVAAVLLAAASTSLVENLDWMRVASFGFFLKYLFFVLYRLLNDDEDKLSVLLLTRSLLNNNHYMGRD